MNIFYVLMLSLLAFLLLIFLLLTIAVITVNLTPVPFIRWMRSKNGDSLSYPENYKDFTSKVKVIKDIQYPSKFRSNALDLYIPANAQDWDSYPTVIWVHGGGFIAGDKSGVENFTTMIASQGYVVVSINYETAPEAKYPAPIIQLGECCRYLYELKSKYPVLDTSRLFFAGDSAGAQIVSQYVAIQTNSRYAKDMNLQQTTQPEDICGALLYCGPYKMINPALVKDRKLRFFLQQMGWSYTGKRNWAKSKEIHETCISKHVTPQFPACYITDGNTGSFEGHAKEMVEVLKANGVDVTSRFFSKEEGCVDHEYQFQLCEENALLAYEDTIKFLKEHCKLERSDTICHN